jgi:hypothetical protein
MYIYSDNFHAANSQVAASRDGGLHAGVIWNLL